MLDGTTLPADKISFSPVYLCRYGNPIWQSRAFYHSFFSIRAAETPDLFVLHKGFDDGECDPAIGELPDSFAKKIKPIWINDEGQDLEAYAKACRLINSSSHLLFFNSHSVLSTDHWHQLFQSALVETKGSGLIGATASWEAITELGVSFPNPHVRTNAFLVARDDYLTAYGPSPRLDKEMSFQLESGPDSLTQLFEKSERPTLVLGRDGALFEPKDWHKSGTFRCGDQDNLVVADNQTRRFQRMNTRKRRQFANNAWRDKKTVEPPPFGQPLLLKIWFVGLYSGYRFKWLDALLRRFEIGAFARTMSGRHK